jgi:hypothetical protein
VQLRVSLFDESEVEAGHSRVASTVSNSIEVLRASSEIILKVLLAKDGECVNSAERLKYLAASTLGFRVVNDAGAAAKLFDCGYFVQSAALIRDISEIGMLMLLFTEQPSELSHWAVSESDRYKKYGRSELKRKIIRKEKFAIFNNYFDEYSEFGTHPSALSLGAHIAPDGMHIGPHVNKKLYLHGYTDLAQIVIHTTDSCGSAYEAAFGSLDREVLAAEFARFNDARRKLSNDCPKMLGGKC